MGCEKRGSIRCWQLAGALLLGGCSGGQDLDVGDQTVGFALTDYAANWDGYAEALTFRDGAGATDSDRVRLVLNRDGTGSLRVGDSDLAPAGVPASDPPLNGYPDGTLLAGYEYPISNAVVEDRRLQFRIGLKFPWAIWCPEQVPYETGNPDNPYQCSPKYADVENAPPHTCFVEDEPEPREVSCGWMQLCVGDYCRCTADACELDSTGPEVVFDAELTDSGTVLEGTLALGDDLASAETPRVTVRMTK